MKVLSAHNVVAVEDGARLVSADRHGDSLGNTGANEIADSRPTEIVKELRWLLCFVIP